MNHATDPTVTRDAVQQPAVEPIHIPPRDEWWVVKTPEGWREVPYRANARSEPKGPFSTRSAAREYVVALEDRDQHAAVWRTVLICLGVVVALGVVLQVLP